MWKLSDRIVKEIATNEDWHPAFTSRSGISYYELRFIKLHSNPGEKPIYRVCAWGADDTGYERDFKSKKRALEIFLEIEDFTKIRTLEEKYKFYNA